MKNFKTDYIDLFLLHRPSPFLNPEEVAKAFSDLQKSGKVLHFGVSNFTAQQFKMLSNYVDKPLITNQVELVSLLPRAFRKWQYGLLSRTEN